MPEALSIDKNGRLTCEYIQVAVELPV